jgi:teichuronic acid biosynthesis glycosyltransferase TuaG
LTELYNRTSVSIITPTHNSSLFIKSTWESIINQSYYNWEWLIIDDNSTDSTKKIIQDIAKSDDRILYFDLVDSNGPGPARNLGIEKSSGRFIAFLDADDRWLPNKLADQVDFMLSNKYVFTYSSYEIINEDGEYLRTFCPPKKLDYHDLLKTCDIGCLTVMYDKYYFGNKYMPSIPKRQDYNLWLELLKKIDYAYNVGKPLAQYRINSMSISRNKIIAIYWIWIVFFFHQRLGLIKSLYYLLVYSLNGITNKIFGKK